MNRILVVGLPRSGTTWIARVLAESAAVAYLEEPDNHFRRAYAFRAKRTLGAGEYPLLRTDDDPDQAREYAALWRSAFEPRTSPRGERARRRTSNRLLRLAGPGRISSALAASSGVSPVLSAAAALAVPEHVSEEASSIVVKSVHAPLGAEWIATRHDVQVVVVLRNPLNVLSSWLELGWLGPRSFDSLSTLDPNASEVLASLLCVPRPSGTTSLAGAAWLVGALTCALDAAARRNDVWIRVVHEALCQEPSEGFAALAPALGLAWTRDGDRLLEQMDRPGSGYELARVASDLPDAWRSRLERDQVREVRETLGRFPLPCDLAHGVDGD